MAAESTATENANKGRYLTWVPDGEIFCQKTNLVPLKELMSLLRECLLMQFDKKDDKNRLHALLKEFSKTRKVFNETTRFPHGIYVDGNLYMDMFNNFYTYFERITDSHTPGQNLYAGTEYPGFQCRELKATLKELASFPPINCNKKVNPNTQSTYPDGSTYVNHKLYYTNNVENYLCINWTV